MRPTHLPLLKAGLSHLRLTEPPLFCALFFLSQTAYSNHLSAKRRPAFAHAKQGFSYFCLALYFVLFTYLKFCNSYFKNSATKRHPAFAPPPRGIPNPQKHHTFAHRWTAAFAA